MSHYYVILRSDGLSAGEVTGKLPAPLLKGNNPEDIGHGNILYISNKSASSGNRVEFNDQQEHSLIQVLELILFIH